MSYDENLAGRIRKLLKRRRNVTEKKMFGGIAFMVKGNMCCGVIGKKLILRLGDENAARALKKKNVSKMDFTGRTIKSMVNVGPAGYKKGGDLKKWTDSAVEFVKTLPAK